MNALSSTEFVFDSSLYEFDVMNNKKMRMLTGYEFDALDKVYHSESMHEMEINADLYGINICNPHVLFFLAKTTAYHYAFWPHTSKRFLAFKNILRKNKAVQKSLKNGILKALLDERLTALIEWSRDDPIQCISGKKQEIKNIRQIIEIINKAINEA